MKRSEDRRPVGHRGCFFQKLWLLGALVPVALALSAGSAAALVLVVDRTDDPNPPMAAEQQCTAAADDCSLRGAILRANMTGGKDTVQVPEGVFTLDSVNGSLVIDDSVDVLGAGAGDCATNGTCIQAAATFDAADARVFTCFAPETKLADMTIRFGVEFIGGGVANFAGSLLLENVVVTDNLGFFGGGGVASGADDVELAVVGGLAPPTMLTIVNSAIEFNDAGFIGGNQVLNLGVATIVGSDLSGFGGGPFPFSAAAELSGFNPESLLGAIGDIGLCGAVANFGEMTITQSTVEGDFGLVGGGICNTPLPPELFLNDATMSGMGLSPVDAVLTLENSAVVNNGALLGGGIWNRAGFILLALFADLDTATFGSAQVFLDDESLVLGNQAFAGGGIMNSRTILGELEIMNAVADATASLNVVDAPGFGIVAGTASVTLAGDSDVVANGALVGGGVLNDQLFVPAFLLALLDEFGNATTAGVLFIPLPEVDPAAVTLTAIDTGIDGNAAFVGAGVANFSATAGVNDSFVEFNFPFDSDLDATLSLPILPLIPSIGGGLYNSDGSVTVTDSQVVANAASIGGGIANVGDGFGLFGPISIVFEALDIFDAPFTAPAVSMGLVDEESDRESTQLRVVRSSIFVNDAFQFDVLDLNGLCCLEEFAGIGAGLYNDFAVASVLNSTFSGNVADTDGGGVANFFDGLVEMTNVTVAFNVAGAGGDFGDGGGIFEVSNNLTIRLKNTLLGNNVDDHFGDFPDCFNAGGTLESLGSNLITVDDGCSGVFVQAGDLIGADPDLEGLEFNGGATPTHRLLGASDAIDAVLDCTDIDATSVTEDQRTFTRPQGSACDIGAYEVGCGDGVVDEGEECDTGAPDDPTDCCSDTCQLEAPTYECRPVAGSCDIAEVCGEGSDGLCPADEVLPADTVCRESADECDPEEVCDGSSGMCPADVPFLDTDGDGACDGVEPETSDDPSKITLQPPGQDPILTVMVMNGCTQILDFEFLPENDLSAPDPFFTYPFDLVSLTLPCASAQVKITFEQADVDLGNGNFRYRFFNPNTGMYADLPGVQLMGNMALLTLVDGGPGDYDVAPATTSGSTGEIRHIGGPAIATGPAPVPALSVRAVTLLLLALGAIGWLGLRRRRHAG